MDPELRKVLEQAAENIRTFHQRQKTESQLEFSDDGTMLGWKVSPLDSVGIYVPGGRAIYPSTLLMNVIPAQVAGVSRIAMVSPPDTTGLPASLVRASAALLGVDELYSLGGAQAVAALAWGPRRFLQWSRSPDQAMHLLLKRNVRFSVRLVLIPLPDQVKS